MVSKHTSQEEWDKRFMKVAKEVSTWSKCLSRKVGSVLVKNNKIISTGVNGPPKGVPHCDFRDDNGNYTNHFVSNVCPRQRMGFESGEGLEYCAAVHSERNPLLQVGYTEGATLYAYCFIGETPVITERGAIPIRNVVIGDKVLTKSGEFKSVINTVIKKYSGQLLVIRLRGMKDLPIITTSDHLFFAKHNNNCVKSSTTRKCFLCKSKCSNSILDVSPNEVKASDLHVDDLLFIPIIKQNSCKVGMPHNSPNFRGKLIPIAMIEDPELFWILGMYIAEGSNNYCKGYPSTIQFALNSKEVSYRDRIARFFGKYGFHSRIDIVGNRMTVIISSSALCSYFSYLCGKLAENKKIPNEIIFSDKFINVVEGIDNGDGSKNKLQRTIKTVSKMLRDQLIYGLPFYGYNVRLHTERCRLDKNGVFHLESYSITFGKGGRKVNRRGDFIKIGSIESLNVNNIDLFDLSVDEDPSYTVQVAAVHNCGTPCLECCKEIINAGVKRVVCLGKSGSSYTPIKDGDNINKKGYNFPLAERLLKLADVKLDVIEEEELK